MGSAVDVERHAGEEEACSEIRNITASATSASVAFRPSGFMRAVVATISSGEVLVWLVFQSRTSCSHAGGRNIRRGQTQFAVTWSAASSTASDSIKPISPNLDAV